MEYHEVANIFPLMEGVPFKELCTDIASNGLIEPIWLWGTKIIDGRNRYRACQEIGIEPDYREWKGAEEGLLPFVLALNLKRRHLTSSQRAAVAVDVENYLSTQAKENQRKGFQKVENPIHSAKQAAQMLGTNTQYVVDAKKVKEADPRRFEQVLAGNLTLKDARREIKAQERIEERGEKLATAPTAPVWVGKFETGCIYQADVTTPEFISQLPENSVDLVVTDPPWDKNSLATYEAAARIAARVLRPGHFMAIYSGKMFLPEIMNILLRDLEYVWTFSVFQPDSNDKIQKYHLYSAWRPVILVKKPGETIDMVWMPDSVKSTRDKKYHEWGQGVELVEKLVEGYTQPGEIVLDPFIGGGSVPYVAKTQKRRYIGFDISEETVRLGLMRLSQ